MAKARRKMRRALMKKMRKGALTPGERRDLMELDREVNKANRQAAGVGGAGLAAALAVASKAGAGDALGDFLDERKKKKADSEAQELKEKEAQRKMEEEFGIRIAEGADRAEEAEREEDRQNLLKRAEEAERAEEAQKKLRSDIDKAAEENPALAALLGRDVDQPDAVQTSKYDSGEGTAFDDLPKNTDYMVDAPVGPINEPAFSSDDLMMSEREDGPRAEEGREMSDPYAPVMTRQGMDLDTMIRLGGRGGSEEDREAGAAASLSDYSPEEVEALIRYDLRQAKGGNTPFLRQMRDRIRKKFR